jgi:hypothetical protein
VYFSKRIRRSIELVAAVSCGLVSFASCTSSISSPSGAGELLDAAEPIDTSTPPDAIFEPTPDAISEPTSDAVSEPYPDVLSDARPDTPIERSSCAAFEALLCNFDGTCPDFAGIGGGGGLPIFDPDGGPDGSKAIRVDVPTGGGGYFAMPFGNPPEVFPPPSIAHCHVTCEANLRIAVGAGLPMKVVLGHVQSVDQTFAVGVRDGGWVQQTDPDASILAGHDASATDEWVHVTIRLSPPDDGGVGSSEATLRVGDASTTTTVPIDAIGTTMFFGAQIPEGTGPAKVYVDDVTCHITE